MSNLFQNESEMTIYEKVREWHSSKGLIFEDNLITQSMKLIEELSELFSLRADLVKMTDLYKNKAIDAVGDSLVCISSCYDILRVILKREDLALEKIKYPEFEYRDQYKREFVFELLKDLSSGVLKRKYEQVEETLAKIIVILVQTCQDYNLPRVRECLEFAYNEIKDRTGKVVDGNFIKEADL